MNKFKSVFVDSLLEVRDRKIFYLYWAVTFIVVLALVFMPDFKINGEDLFNSGLVSPEMIDKAISSFFDQFFGFMIFLMVFGSAGLVPAFLKKGRIELTLSKPIDRYKLLMMKFVSVFLIMCAILAICTTIIWAVLSFKLGSFSLYFFLGLIFAFLQFFAVYSLVFLLGVMSNSTAASIMGYFIIRIGTDLLSSREVIYQFLGESLWKTVLDAIYHIMPKIGEMADNYGPLMLGNGIEETYPVYSTIGISGILILLTLLIFNRRDY